MRALRQGNDQEPLKLLRSMGRANDHFQVMHSCLQLMHENIYLSALDISDSITSVFATWTTGEHWGKANFGGAGGLKALYPGKAG